MRGEGRRARRKRRSKSEDSGALGCIGGVLDLFTCLPVLVALAGSATLLAVVLGRGL